MNITDILSIIPQRMPFVMVSKLLHADEQSACTELLITSDNIFVRNGMFIEAGIIENMAQTCAAGMGYINANTTQDEVRIGFLSAIRNLIIKRLPKVGETLHTCVSIVEHFVGMMLIKTEVKINDETIAEGEMKIFITGYV
jgi:predicted hotdog family 3-hydroxylacyl-ACP dehydratase